MRKEADTQRQATERASIQVETSDFSGNLEDTLVREINQYAEKVQVFRVGRKGGICVNNQCSITLSVPEGALREETLLYLGEAKIPTAQPPGPNYKRVSRDIVCGPDSVSFMKPVYLTFKTTFTAVSEAELPELYTTNSDGCGNWKKIDRAFFSIFSVSAELRHFCRFTAFMKEKFEKFKSFFSRMWEKLVNAFTSNPDPPKRMSIFCFMKKIESKICGMIIIIDSAYGEVRQFKVRRFLIIHFPV